MPRYPTKSWRAFDPTAPAPVVAVRPLARESLRILGLDPGSRRMGWGVIECRGPDYTHVAHGCIDAAPGALVGRLRGLHAAVAELIGAHCPDEVAVERVFVSHNVDSALKLGQARGAALAAVPDGATIFEYAPRAIKLALVGTGAAEKSQVAQMIRALLGLEGRIATDASDALAVAVCHAHSRRLALLGVACAGAAS
jgi:crossover junction endodeoxyribonuclease RuvC